MAATSIRGLVADTGFWIAAFDPNDQYHAKSAALLERLTNEVIIMPWPIIYEVLRTKTVKRPHMMEAFSRVLSYRKKVLVDDSKYRSDCLDRAFDTARSNRPISLVDMIIRDVLMDKSYRITRLLTLNVPDFVDVCRERGITMWPPTT